MEVKEQGSSLRLIQAVEQEPIPPQLSGQPRPLPSNHRRIHVRLHETTIAATAEGKSETKTTAREAFIKKVQTCMNTYNYADENKDAKGKAERLTAINDLQTMLGDQKSVVSNIIPSLEMVMDMIEKNIFRPLPNIKKSTNIGLSETGIEQEEQVDPSWPHLQGIYEFFLQLILNDAADVKSMKVYITPQFIQGVGHHHHG